MESFALGGDPHAYKFAVPLARREDCNFSYAGIKTAVLLAVQRLPEDLDEAALQQVASWHAAQGWLRCSSCPPCEACCAWCAPHVPGAGMEGHNMVS